MALDTTIPRSRRTLLAGAFGGVVAVAVQAVRPLTARAEGETIHVGDNLFTATTATYLKNSTTDNDVLIGGTTKAGRGVYGISKSGVGVEGASAGYAGVYGRNSGGPGVRGKSNAGSGVLGEGTYAGVSGNSEDGYGVTGKSLTDVGVYGSGPHAGVFGRSGFGPGVHGRSAADIGVLGISYGDGSPSIFGMKDITTGSAVVGAIFDSSSGSAAIMGTTTGSGQGVLGQSDKGRGGVFGSPVAQVRLLPSAAATHPADGSKGDLFVDTSGRLWFCKGNTNWVQLA